MDPRVPTPAAGLALQLALAQRSVAALRADSIALAEVRAWRARLVEARSRVGGDTLGAAIDSLDRRVTRLATGAGASAMGFGTIAADLAGLYGVIEGSDAAPTTQAIAGLARLERELAAARRRWAELRDGPLAKLDRRLRATGGGPAGPESLHK
jgi:hypothetical protein